MSFAHNNFVRNVCVCEGVNRGAHGQQRTKKKGRKNRANSSHVMVFGFNGIALDRCPTELAVCECARKFLNANKRLNTIYE